MLASSMDKDETPKIYVADLIITRVERPTASKHREFDDKSDNSV